MRRLPATLMFLFGLILIGASFGLAQGQANSPDSEWRPLNPEGEEFSVLMPKDPTIEISKVPYHKMELNSRVYLLGGQTGPVFAVVSLSGIKSNPAAYTEMARVNSYVDAVKDIFPAKVRGKDSVVKFTLVGSKTLNGYAGRDYKLTIGDLSGTAQVFATKKRFYAIIFLDTKKENSLQERFLSSFTLPEKVTEPATTVVVQNPPVVQNPAKANETTRGTLELLEQWWSK